MQHLQPNTTLQGGRYRIKDVLGQGGFGITYLAKDNSLGVYVAVKEFFMKDLCSRDEATLTMNSSGGSLKQVERYREKFIKEARNLSRLHHLHIISVIDVFEENGTVYYSMPYMKGGSLQDYVKNTRPMTEVEAMKIIRQIADALKYMHEVEHICHYDVKPSNILLDDRGNAMLIDFGIAKNYDEDGHETSTTPIGRSEGYAPIEQYQQNVEEFSPASDVYGLGATLLFAMTGKRPTSVIERVGGTPLEMPRYCSEPIKELIFSSMIIQRKYRPQSTRKFLEYDLPKVAPSPVVAASDESTLVDQEPRQVYRPEPAKSYENVVSHKDYSPRPSNNIKSGYSPSKPKDDSKLFLWLCLAGVIIIMMILYGLFGGKKVSETSDTKSNKRIVFITAIGSCQYVGSVDSQNVPNGDGEAYFDDGRYYKGNFEHGNLTGDNVYFKYPIGDTFKGEFRNNLFYRGTYTIAKDGSYFVGYFKNGQPNSGIWYDKDGNVIENI